MAGVASDPVQDDHIASVAGTEQRWTAYGWVERFGLPFPPSVTGYGQSSTDIAAVAGVSAENLAAYRDAVCEHTLEYLGSLGDDELDRVVDTSWNPPVTLAARLVSVIIDALVHAVESYTSRRRNPGWGSTLPVFMGRNEPSSLLALETIRLIGGNLRTAVLRPDDREAREAMSLGSLLTGMAFGAAGTHLSHALQYPIGALSHTPHGLGTGMLLPYVMQACLAETEPELAAIGRILGASTGSDAEAAQAAIDEVAALAAAIGIPTTLAGIGITEEQLPRIAELSLGVTRLVNNASLEASPDLVMTILKAALAGDRSTLL